MPGDITNAVCHDEHRCSLQQLPHEILAQILDYLAYPSLSNFQSTNHFFLELPNQEHVLTARQTYVDALYLNEHFMLRSNSLQKYRFLHCFGCYSLLARENFEVSRTVVAAQKSIANLASRHAWERVCSFCMHKPDMEKWLLEPTIAYSQARQQVMDEGLALCMSRRRERCMRCWMVDHTFRRAVNSTQDLLDGQRSSQPLCKECHRQHSARADASSTAWGELQ